LPTTVFVTFIAIFGFLGRPQSALALQPGSCEQSLNLTDGDKAALIWGELGEFWIAEMAQRGVSLKVPVLVLYTGKMTTRGCGEVDLAAGPGYCPADRKVYFDPNSLKVIRTRFGAQGESVLALVLAHEFGHAVLDQMGVPGIDMLLRHKWPPTIAPVISRLDELTADGLAGYFFGHLTNKGYADQQDIREAAHTSLALGDDSVRKVLGFQENHVFPHGSGDDRKAAFESGWKAQSLDAVNGFVQLGDECKISGFMTPDECAALGLGLEFPAVQPPRKRWFGLW
jgi:predicted metalloprotease